METFVAVMLVILLVSSGLNYLTLAFVFSWIKTKLESSIWVAVSSSSDTNTSDTASEDSKPEPEDDGNHLTGGYV